MKTLIVGSGAIGTFLGGVLHRAGMEITFFDLPEVVKRIKEQGLCVEGIGEKIEINNPGAVSEIDESQHYNLILIAVKAYSTRAVLGSIPENAGDFILSFQNGIGNEEIIAEKFGKNRVIAGSITYPVAFPEPGHVRIENPKAGIGISPVNPGVNVDEIRKILIDAGLNAITADDYRSLKWSKLVLNLVCNATCAILDLTPAEIFSDTALVNIEKRQIMETLNVMNRLGIRVINLPGYPTRLLASLYSFFPAFLLRRVLGKKISEGRGDKKPSLLLSLEKGAENSEVKYLNGAVYKYACQAAIECRVNKIITETLEDIVNKTLSREDFRGNRTKFLQLFEGK